MREFDEKSITQAVIGRLAECEDPRFKGLMTSLITHLHDFVREVKLTEPEWLAAIQFLTDVESTVLGPFYWQGAPELPRGSNLAEGVNGEPTIYSGHVLSVNGRPLENALLDIWSGDGEGNYDMQMAGETGMRARGTIRTDADGRYWFRSIKPTFYPVPTDGPVGRMLLKMGRHPYRPGHIHMIVSAPGHLPVTTHLFVAGSQYLDTDAVFGMKESLVAQFHRHPPGVGPNGERMDTPYYTVSYDFRLRLETLPLSP
jgi:hydroxyquinol 1,2-dioxygenase